MNGFGHQHVSLSADDNIAFAPASSIAASVLNSATSIVTSKSGAIVAIIPARFSSTRLPAKPLLEIANRPMILYTVERALAAQHVSRVIVATDDERICEAVSRAGYDTKQVEVVMTRQDHRSGTDRLAEVAATFSVDVEIVANVQADEPLIAPETIDLAIEALLTDPEAQMSTTSEPIVDARDVLSPDVVKVVADERGRAIYFSRSPVPFPRDLVRRYGTLALALEQEPVALGLFRKHTGLYAYRREFLLRYAGWQTSTLEQVESLEQLRALAAGVHIKVVESAAESIGVDTEADLERVRMLIEK